MTPRRWLPAIIAAFAVTAGLASCASAAHAAATAPRPPEVGVYEPGVVAWEGDTIIDSWKPETSFPLKPRIVLYYSGWDEPFQTTFAEDAYRHGAEVLLDLNPCLKSPCTAIPGGLKGIADGTSDAYLVRLAQEIAASRRTVMVSFGHEMNGNWYWWGRQPRAFIAAWRHVVDVMRPVAPRIIWLWKPNAFSGKPGADAAPFGPYWPGARYVNRIGLDGYWWSAGSTFASIFAPALREARKLTRDPVMIAETGTLPGHRIAELRELFAGAEASRLMAVCYFDQDEAPAQPDWRLEGDRAAMLALKTLSR